MYVMTPPYIKQDPSGTFKNLPCKHPLAPIGGNGVMPAVRRGDDND